MHILRTLSLSLTATASLWVLPVQADDELRDRYIAATQVMGDKMLKVINDCAPDIDTSDVDFDYSERMTEAVGCVIEGHIDRFGKGETEALVGEMEALSERSFSSLQEMTALQTEYPRLSENAMMELNMACGTMEASQDLDLTRVMQDNMASLAGCFTQE